MATSNIAFPINLRQNKNSYTSAYGKYYAEVDTKEPLNLKGFAKHISDHGKLVTFDLAQLVLVNIVSCLKELITQGQPVKLDGFGTFTPYVENDGKEVTYQEKIPISSYAAATHQADGNGGNGGGGGDDEQLPGQGGNG